MAMWASSLPWELGFYLCSSLRCRKCWRLTCAALYGDAGQGGLNECGLWLPATTGS